MKQFVHTHTFSLPYFWIHFGSSLHSVTGINNLGIKKLISSMWHVDAGGKHRQPSQPTSVHFKFDWISITTVEINLTDFLLATWMCVLFCYSFFFQTYTIQSIKWKKMAKLRLQNSHAQQMTIHTSRFFLTFTLFVLFISFVLFYMSSGFFRHRFCCSYCYI